MEQDNKVTPIAAGVAEALEAQARPPVDPQIAQDFNLVGQYVRDNIAKEAPATQMVMGQVLNEAIDRLKKALGG